MIIEGSLFATLAVWGLVALAGFVVLVIIGGLLIFLFDCIFTPIYHFFVGVLWDIQAQRDKSR